MRIAIVGAGGKAGSRLMHEAVLRGYPTTAVIRGKARLREPVIPVYESVLVRDLFDLTSEDMRPFDVVMDAFKAPDGQEAQHVSSIRHLIAILKPLPQTRLMVVGGAGSLLVEPGNPRRLMETNSFPAAYLPTAVHMAKAFEILAASDINWTYASPAAFFDPDGPATGEYSLGTDSMILNEEGESYVSYADFAKAMLDEVENRAFIKRRFTVVSNRS